MSESASLPTAALDYAHRGWAVLPLHTPQPGGGCSCGSLACDSQGKHPRTLNGKSDASSDQATIRRWWKQWPDANVGVACRASRLLVLDVDERHGGSAALERLYAKLGPLPFTLTVKTGNGWHYYFQLPEALGDAVGKLAEGVEVKFNGYVVAPPSLHPSGATYHPLETGVEAPEVLPEYPGGRPQRSAPRPLTLALRSTLPECSPAFPRVSATTP